MVLGELPPDPLLPGDRVHGDAGVPGPLDVLGVREPEQDLPDALLRQRVDQTRVAAARGRRRAGAVPVLGGAGPDGRRGEVLLVLHLKEIIKGPVMKISRSDPFPKTSVLCLH